ncbi:MAG TPA: hypothetical protein VMV46_11420 [Thermoanaerobaculia bacterium]|nr:hypothetical protein [Thermoanaerobaculia bacterium]
MHELAGAVLATVERRVQDDLERRGPALRGLSPRSVRLVGERVTIADVTDVVASHPFLDAGDFLARLVAELPGRGDSDRLADRFRAAYLAGAPDQLERLRSFEAAALLRIACRTQAVGDGGGADRLLAVAAERALARARAVVRRCRGTTLLLSRPFEAPSGRLEQEGLAVVSRPVNGDGLPDLHGLEGGYQTVVVGAAARAPAAGAFARLARGLLRQSIER